MWESESSLLPGGRGQRVKLSREGRPASVKEMLTALRDEAGFRGWFNAILADSPYAAFRWETPGVRSTTLDRRAEFVMLDSPGLARAPEPEAFAEHFRAANPVVTFANLRGDARLIVPCPIAEAAAYGHLAAFVRRAPESQRDALWKTTALAMLQRVDARPAWLSTAGAGVSWLHVRIDDRPKYYGFAEYASST